MLEKLREIKDAALYVPVGDGFFDPYDHNIEAVDAAVARALSALQTQDAPAKGDAGDEVIQADRDAAADLYLDLRGEPLRDHERMRGSDMVKGLYDDSEEIQAFRNHRLQSTAELRAKLGRVSAGAYASLRSEEPTYELQSLMRSSYAVFCLKKNTYNSKI